MARLRNVARRAYGAYGEDGYHQLVMEDAYEERRFLASRGGRRKLRQELALVAGFLVALPPDGLILDAPSGMGRFTGLIRETGHRPVSLDLNIGMLGRARARHGNELPLLQGNVLALPFRDGAFDAAICVRLLHHLPDNLILQVLAELRRVSRAALVTFYDTRCVKYWSKRLRGRHLSGQYYPAPHVIALTREAGWPSARQLDRLAVHRNLHALQLAS